VSLDLIVEVGNAHEGSLGIATSFVDIVKSTGAKCIKFQMHLPEFESSENEPFRKKFSAQDKTRFDYWNRVGFSFEEWKYLISYTKGADLEFLCTPFSVEAAKWLFENAEMRRWKVGSGEATNFPLLSFLAESELPILISTGLVSWNELLKIREFLSARRAWERVTLMHCVSQYPTPLEFSALNLLDDLRKLDVNVGLSDHSGDVAVALRAISLGVNTIEVHMTPHLQFFGPDTTSSLLSADIELLISISKKWDLIDLHKVSREQTFNNAEETKRIFGKGIYWKRDLTAGQLISMEDLAFLKPSSEVSAMEYLNIIGKITVCEVKAKSPLFRSEIRD
jgi:N,N'-diacetyllegionaminate synthase